MNPTAGYRLAVSSEDPRAAGVTDRRFFGGIAAAVSVAAVLLAGSILGWLLISVHYGSGVARLDGLAATWGAANIGETSAKALRAITLLGALPIIAVFALATVATSVGRRKFGSLVYLAIACGGVSILNNGLKVFLHRRRPAFAPLTAAAGWSFPSGHSAAAAAGWAAIALVAFRRSSTRRRTAAMLAAVLITVVVAASRVLLGVHWVTDVIAGATVGWSWFLVVTLMFGGSLVRLGESDRPGEVGGTPKLEPD